MNRVHLALLLTACALFTSAADQSKSAPGVKSIADPPGIHNLFALGTNVYSGSAPEGEAGFAALARLGIKTVITVDGAQPQVDLARKHGMRYVHLPHGYDGINTNLQQVLAKAGQQLPGPIYVHCHHGKHRGPAAAAILCMANEGWSPAQAERWLLAAGTATNYAGLYQVVRQFRKPAREELQALPADFPETAKVSGLVESMVGIDECWEHLKTVRGAGYTVPKGHPDIVPANEAVILSEHYREAQRLPEAAHRGTNFVARLATAEAEAKAAERLLRLFQAEPQPETRGQLDLVFDAMGKTCSACHKNYRDAAGSPASP